jgi:hypothetical protein
MQTHASADVVSPSKLLSIACERFALALRIVGSNETPYVPTALAASVAIREATSGIGALQSVLVPSTPWGPREIAAAAMTQAKRALTQLEQYREVMGPRGERSWTRADLDPGTLVLLDTARASLRQAVQRIP